MKNALSELKALMGRWETLRDSRPTETDFSAWCPGLTAQDIDELFDTWRQDLETAIGRTRATDEPEEKVIDATVAKLFREIVPQIDSATSRGIAWLIQHTVFPAHITAVASYLLPILNKRASVRRGLIKIAATKLNDEIQSVAKAAPLAEQVIKYHQVIVEQKSSIEGAQQTATATSEELEQLEKLATTQQLEIETLLTNANQRAASIDKLTTELHTTVEEAQTALDEVNQQKADADETIKTSTELLGQANEKLTKALQDINRQALAGAFHDKARAVGLERWVWAGAFAGAIGWLAVVGKFIFSVPSDGGKAVFDWYNLLRGLPLVAPAIWLGWFSAKQTGMLGRIQQDYDYKAATAVAFEGYKKEVATANDETLSKQLLETAVRNFGDNPIRLYNNKKDDHAMPIESLIETVKDDSTWSRVIDLIKALKPERRA